MQLDYSRDSLFTPLGLAKFKNEYMLPEEKSPQEALARAAKAYASNDAHAQRLYNYASKHWFMFATPVIANAGTERGLPISCFLNYVEDSRRGLMEHQMENIFLSSGGGGIGAYWGTVRSNGTATSKGSASTGVIPFLKWTDAQTIAFHQGRTRRGAYAAYLDVSHPEIREFIKMRKPGSGDENRKAFNINTAVNIPDAFMEAVRDGNEWNLVDPHSKEITETVSARQLWIEILETRVAIGRPFIHFSDASNRALHPAQKALGLRINQSNLCSEILQVTSEDRTAVCCLSSVNLEYWDEWRNDLNFIEDIVEMLDNVLDVFIEKAPSELERAVFSAKQERSIGLGAMGFHSYLQKVNVPFESAMAIAINRNMFKGIYEKAILKSVQLGQERGVAPDIVESGVGGWENLRRNVNVVAVAPNATSSITCGETSPSIEPWQSVSLKRVSSLGSTISRNPYFTKRLEALGKNTKEVWDSIDSADGSIRHLDFLTDHDKAVFRPAFEIDQYWILEHAAHRQQYICQGQSLNLFMLADVNKKDLHEIHFAAWEKGLKTLYYLRSGSIAKAEFVDSKIERKEHKATETEADECLACHG